MTARRFVPATSIALLAFCLSAFAQVNTQDVPPVDVENSKYQFAGVVNSNAVYVRSGPSENDYPTLKLDKGAEITVVGIRYDWLKVTPPVGSFCYVAKAYVDRHGNGSVGRVTSTLNVRVGSQLNELKAKIATKLEPGASVEILGEEQEYFKIKPPEGVFYFVNKQFVDPVRALNLADANPPGPQPDQMARVPQEPTATEEPKQQPDASAEAPSISETPQTADNTRLGGNPTPEPEPARTDTYQPPTSPEFARGTAHANKDDYAPATQPTASAEAEFERLEAAYTEATLKPLGDQPITELLDGYQKLADSDRLPESLRRIADFKSQVLKYRLEAQQQLVDTRKHLEDMSQKQMALNAEREELEQRIKENEVQFYTAVGTLRPSSLQQGAETLYRLTDPANGRTSVYLRSNDAKMAAMLGQFIGVRGEVQNDARLNVRVITPTAFEAVNPAKVGQSIAAQIVPPSLLPRNATTPMDELDD